MRKLLDTFPSNFICFSHSINSINTFLPFCSCNVKMVYIIHLFVKPYFSCCFVFFTHREIKSLCTLHTGNKVIRSMAQRSEEISQREAKGIDLTFLWHSLKFHRHHLCYTIKKVNHSIQGGVQELDSVLQPTPLKCPRKLDDLTKGQISIYWTDASLNRT